jgi:hypothetical protein
MPGKTEGGLPAPLRLRGILQRGAEGEPRTRRCKAWKMDSVKDAASKMEKEPPDRHGAAGLTEGPRSVVDGSPIDFTSGNAQRGPSCRASMVEVRMRCQHLLLNARRQAGESRMITMSVAFDALDAEGRHFRTAACGARRCANPVPGQSVPTPLSWFPWSTAFHGSTDFVVSRIRGSYRHRFPPGRDRGRKVSESVAGLN